MNKPMTTGEFFDKICKILKEKGVMPDILEYGVSTYSPVPMTTYEFDIKNNLDYGGNEGIYLHLWIEYYRKGERHTNNLGTFKTLRKDKEAMHIMSTLLADFIIEEHSYVNLNLDDFAWEGVDVYPCNDNGEPISLILSCSNIKVALERKDELLKKYPQVVVRNNETRKEKIFRRE